MHRLMEIDVLEVSYELHMIGDDLYRIGSDEILNNQVKVCVNGKQYKTSRLIYTLKHGISPTQYLLLNDDNQYIQVDQATKQMYNYRFATKTTKCRDGYLARWSDKEGKRSSKVFKLHRDAERYAKQMVIDIWSSKLIELKLYDSYLACNLSPN